MEVWKIVFHSILEIFHSIPFWHLPYSIPKFPFHSIPFHTMPCRPVPISALNDSFANECGVLKLLDVINHCFGSSYENTDASLFLTKSPLQVVSTNFLSNLFWSKSVTFQISASNDVRDKN